MTEKLRCEQVPQKFTEWLLEMGCPPAKVPSVDKVSQMCRGQYYLVWRSLMEHVGTKDIVKEKRLQVFVDDVRNYQKKNILNKAESSTVKPEVLNLWEQQMELHQKVNDAEDRVMKSRQILQNIIEKISSKMAQRNSSRQSLQEVQRRVWLLSKVSEELTSKKANLVETKAIAESLCCVGDEKDVKSKLDKCISTYKRPSPISTSILMSNPIASSSVVSASGDNENDEQVWSLHKCNAELLWKEFCERRASLVNTLAVANAKTIKENHKYSITSKRVLSQTAALQCMLGLEAMKNRINTEKTRKRLADAVAELNNILTGEACELLVLRSERAQSDARVNTLRSLLEDVTSQRDIFATNEQHELGHGLDKQIANIDKNIINKREELKRLISTITLTERKIYNITECLVYIFNGFHKDDFQNEPEAFRGLLDLPSNSITNIRRFYEERRENKSTKLDLSMNFDSPDKSLIDIENNSPKFVDELRIYLNKFDLNKNRKLVLESGEKMWEFETLQASLQRLHKKLLESNMPVHFVCPSVTVSKSIHELASLVQRKQELEKRCKQLEDRAKRSFTIDIEKQKAEEQMVLEKIKRRLNENLLTLNKTMRTLGLGQENLKFWTDNKIRFYISNNRTVDGRRYKDYETMYLHSFS